MTRGSLSAAILKGKENLVKIIISRGTPVNFTDRLGRTPLHIAAGKSDAAIIKLLLKHKANVDAQDFQGRTPLHFATSTGNLAIVKLLVNAPSVDGKSANINSGTFHRYTPLHIVALEGRWNLIKYFVENGADVNARESLTGCTPLHFSACSGHVSTVQELIKCGADVHALTKQCYSPLHYAVFGKIRAKDKQRKKTLSCFTGLQMQKQAKIIDILFEAGVTLNPDKSVRSPFHFAAQRNNDVLLKKLLHYGAQVNAFDNKGFSAIHLAAAEGSPNIIRILLNAGAEVNIKCSVGNLPIHYAIMYFNVNVISTLVQAGADINAKSSYDDPVFLLSFKNKIDPKNEFLNILLESGADINARDEFNNTIFHFLGHKHCCGYNDFFATIIDQFLDFNAVNQNGKTALDCALKLLKDDRTETAAFIIKAIVKMESTNKFSINELNKKIIETKCLKYYENCKKEMEYLKIKRVWGNISFYDLLDQPIKKLVSYSRNQELIRILNPGICRTFPAYGDFIQRRMQIALKKRIMLDNSVAVLDSLINIVHLPWFITLEILNFLNSRDLESVSKA
ncbi:putative ankyrin repeat protein RF_0381 [Belonocnema kinseyi]|uniref:putative ankyrin repeat protein RF_0381 n=1 Tax=Belonocnema kinseyi TaxID=2817044 RepID=UPI00143D02F3|nr:putative ankyrin repeat protein RF_0381 [Belonocnema kinseyi]